MNEGDADPWSGDDVPVAAGLGEIVWDAPDKPDVESTESGATGLSRRLAIPFVAVAVIGAALLAVFAWPDGDETGAAEPTSSEPTTPTTLDTLPPAVTSAPTAPAEPDETVVDSLPVPTIIELPAGDVPQPIADSETPTEVVVVTDEGELITLALPSGDVVQRVDLQLSSTSRFNGAPGNLVVSPDAALYGAGDDLVVTPSGGEPLAIDRDDFGDSGGPTGTQLFPFGWTTDVDGANVFVVVAIDSIGQQSEWLVSVSGDVKPAPAQRAGSFARPIYSLGTRFIDDAGGAYRVDPDGDSNRVSRGQILATSETQLLLRECNANRLCNAVLRDYDGNEVRVVNLPPTFRPVFFAASLSPDGGAITYGDPSFDGERTIIDLESGDTHVSAERARDIAQPTWTTDSSGIFTFGTEDGIRFLDRASGDEFAFAEELGQVRAIATRLSTP